ncbi:hypothetical protein [Natrialba sp. PRR66]|uniref:hypothetical protein n=1 Tax=Natrialba sp. PRR66 TaxID=3098146 RepID=UPI002B1DBF26|nr:hypothetical protein [Natrialba sp. PRR66]
MDGPRRDSSQRDEATSAETGVDRRRVLRAGTGLAATTLGIAALGGQAAAHFPPDLEIEIKPGSGSDPAPINPRSQGVVPVVVLQTDEFDPTSEPVRYRFGAPDVVGDGGGARPVHDGHEVDVNGDGRTALQLHFPVDETGFDGDESSGRLEWERTDDGNHGLAGTGAVTIVSCQDPGRD